MQSIETMLASLPVGKRGPKANVLRESLTSARSADECWPWQGRTGTNGYGIAVIPGNRGRGTSAHRLVWILLNGDIPDGLQVDHVCHRPQECNLGNRCPHRACVNPSHLRLVTASENMHNSNSSALLNKLKTHCHKGHAFTEDNTYVEPGGGRTCRTCQRANWRRYDAAKREAKNATVRPGSVRDS